MKNSDRTAKNISSRFERKNISRVFFAGCTGLLLYFIIIVKLINVQIINHSRYSERYSAQSRKRMIVYAPKGNIYDRRYRTLSENIGMNYAFGINTRAVEDKAGLSKRIAQITGGDHRNYLKGLNSRNGFLWLTQNLTEKQKNDILRALTERESFAASFRLTPNRVYPNGRTASHIIGYTNIDGEGLSGIEKEFCEQLTGIDGWEYIYRDAMQNRSYGSVNLKKEPEPGHSIVLTIDQSYQAIAEDELKKAVERWKAEKGVVILMEPNSGEIMAMAGYPDFDPNDPGRFDPSARKATPVTDMYEPGSTFKTLTSAMLFEENLLREDDEFFCDNKGIMIGRRRIRDSHENEEELMKYKDVFAESSNIGTLLAASRLDKAKHFSFLRAFGFGSRTDIELTGEVSGMFPRLRNWSLTTQPTISFGQGISVTPLQMAVAYSAIANGGTLLKPMIVKGIIDKDNRVVKKYDVQPVRRVIGASAAQRTRNLLRYAVENGTGRNAEIEGLRVGGKTGTSQKVVDGSYSSRFYDASFIGIVPYDDPKLVCLVLISSPRGSIYGGTVAAPVFKNIISRIYDENRISNIAERSQAVRYKEVPELRGLRLSESENILKEIGINYVIAERGSVVSYQSLRPFSLVSDDTYLIISSVYSEGVLSNSESYIPDVISLSSREAVTLMRASGINPVLVGRGNIHSHSDIFYDESSGAKICTLFASHQFKNNLLTGRTR